MLLAIVVMFRFKWLMVIDCSSFVIHGEDINGKENGVILIQSIGQRAIEAFSTIILKLILTMMLVVSGWNGKMFSTVLLECMLIVFIVIHSHINYNPSLLRQHIEYFDYYYKREEERLPDLYCIATDSMYEMKRTL